jgi:hypothetical protein
MPNPDSALTAHSPDVRLAWYSWERVREVQATRVIMLGACALALALLAAMGAMTRPTVVFVRVADAQSPGERFRAAEISGASPLRGNTPRDLELAARAATDLVTARFNLTAETVRPNLQWVEAHTTTQGRGALRAGLPIRTLSDWIMKDAGILRTRVWGTGAVAVGEAPGHVRVTIPVIGTFYSKHVAFRGVGTGIPLGTEIVATMRRGERDLWWLDKLDGDVLDSGMVALWEHYGVTDRPLPRFFVQDKEISADSATRVAWTLAPRTYP